MQARRWVKVLREAWLHCFKHTLRDTDEKGAVRGSGGEGDNQDKKSQNAA